MPTRVSRRYYLRPIWDARHVVRVLPSGGYEMATSTRGRRHVATPLSLDDIELLIGGWSHACQRTNLDIV